jgi:hypothetical protein
MPTTDFTGMRFQSRRRKINSAAHVFAANDWQHWAQPGFHVNARFYRYALLESAP